MAARAKAQSVLETTRILEQTASDTSLPAAVRGAAATELAIAYENVWPSYATKSAQEDQSGPWKLATGRIVISDADHPLLNRTRAVELYELGAELGNETAQFRMGTLYASGALGVEQDQVKMALHYYFAAVGGSIHAQMALGFRHSIGLGVPRDCKTAVLYYELAANTAADQIERDGVGPLNERERLSLDQKSHSYTGRRAVRSEDEEIVDYYKHAAEKGDLAALVALGQIYFYGARGVERDHETAAMFFRRAAASGDPLAQATLGHMLVKGMAVERDLKAAYENFSAAAEAHSAAGKNGLGYMYLYGLHVKQDRSRATKLFDEAAEMGNAEALYNAGALFATGTGSSRRNYPMALNYFQVAVQKGHTLAMHKLAQMNLHGIGTPRQCENAMHLFKAVAERGEPVQLLSRAFVLWNSYDDIDSALHIYLVASELGYEVAQSNAAWLLDYGADIRGSVQRPGASSPVKQSPSAQQSPSATSGKVDDFFSAGSHGGVLPFPLSVIQDIIDIVDQFLRLKEPSNRSLDALRLYELAAEQENVDARLKIGDYYYYGLGVMDGPDFELAAFHYKLASKRRNAQAMFNLGFMHQHGIGLDRDFHLAKRYYDLAESADADAKIPVSLALSGLWMHRIYRAIVFGESSTNLPAVVSTLARWYAFLQGSPAPHHGASSASPDTAEVSASTSSSSSQQAAQNGETPAAPLSSQAFDALATLAEFEDDTVVAIVLSILLVIVLMLRSRDQQRRALHRRLRQAAAASVQHPHQD
ncbi:Protein sel-1-like 1 [Hondaea fermentalgiana]|uniref:Protein sel-1-like 1 n=1 Tax=Hondaea fermentalgiana TaxID=2315210 RepID=A0A2R5G787_9STRA|nr:Protein sel-1-like 1 [Hondaea fermentalgiana]|eukprot:GBG26189.1 Protein sel-1-like 1 [Hondaea fermentalgiana]